MTNAEKYKEVFGMEVDQDMCPTKDCPNCPCENCETASTFWKKEYKGGAECISYDALDGMPMISKKMNGGNENG